MASDCRADSPPLWNTPYNKDLSRTWAEHFVGLGYVAIAQDTRGRYGSEGIWHMMTDDPNDGYEPARSRCPGGRGRSGCRRAVRQRSAGS